MLQIERDQKNLVVARIVNVESVIVDIESLMVQRVVVILAEDPTDLNVDHPMRTL